MPVELDLAEDTAAEVFSARKVRGRLRVAGKPPITMAELDYAVWSLGRKAKYLHHLTRTTAY